MGLARPSCRGVSWRSSVPDVTRSTSRRCKSLAAELGITEDVVFVGGVPLEETVSFYRAADVFVYPSLNETFGLPILEAMACGCPVVTSDTSAMPETAGGAALLCRPEGSGVDRPGHGRGGRTGRERLRELGLQAGRGVHLGSDRRGDADVYREAQTERTVGTDRNEDPRHRRRRVHRVPYLRPAAGPRARCRRARRAQPACPPGPAARIPRSGSRLLPGRHRNRDLLTNLLRRVDAVYHFAAYQDYLPDFSQFSDVNVVSTALIYEIIVAERLDLARVVVASSSPPWVRGSTGARSTASRCQACGRKALAAGQWDIPCPQCGGPLQMQATPERISNPQNAYGMSKLGEEMVAVNLGRRYGIPTVALRYSIVQGPRQSVYNAYSGACRIFCLSYLLGRRRPSTRTAALSATTSTSTMWSTPTCWS